MKAGATAGLAHALLIGQGRSGTNFLLSLLDQSPRTHCRNEPDQLDRSALARLSDFRFFVDDEPRLAALYPEAVSEAALALGPRDHMAGVPKDWLRPGTARAGYFYLRQRYRLVERLLRRRKPMDGRELAYPRWMAAAPALERAFHVFKLNAAVGLGSWALRSRPEVRVIQIVRHPGGFAKSWLARWVRGQGEQQRGRGNPDRFDDRERLRELARRDPRWARLLGDVEGLDRAEGELWWWRYVNEALHVAGTGSESYRLVLYEDLAVRPLEITRGVYSACGLELDADVAARVQSIARGAEKIARAWRDELEPELVVLVERVLSGSPMEGWWSDALARTA
jgi:hypothetical protein